jgi:hypothetical protein
MKKFLYGIYSSIIFSVLAWMIVILGVAWSITTSIKKSYNYQKAYYDGYNESLDTISKIMFKQVHSDTSHCSYVIIDTSYYILEHKKCK